MQNAHVLIDFHLPLLSSSSKPTYPIVAGGNEVGEESKSRSGRRKPHQTLTLALIHGFFFFFLLLCNSYSRSPPPFKTLLRSLSLSFPNLPPFSRHPHPFSPILCRTGFLEPDRRAGTEIRPAPVENLCQFGSGDGAAFASREEREGFDRCRGRFEGSELSDLYRIRSSGRAESPSEVSNSL